MLPTQLPNENSLFLKRRFLINYFLSVSLNANSLNTPPLPGFTPVRWAYARGCQWAIDIGIRIWHIL